MKEAIRYQEESMPLPSIESVTIGLPGITIMFIFITLIVGMLIANVVFYGTELKKLDKTDPAYKKRHIECITFLWINVGFLCLSLTVDAYLFHKLFFSRSYRYGQEAHMATLKSQILTGTPSNVAIGKSTLRSISSLHDH
jgi:hypothetical protein